MPMTVKWRVKRLPGRAGWEGELVFPDLKGYAHAMRSQGSTPEKAVGKAGTYAAMLAANPAVAALLPPGAAPALAQVTKLAQSQAARQAAKAAVNAARRLKFW